MRLNLCPVSQQPPSLSTEAQSQLLSPPVDVERDDKIRRQFNFRDGSVLIAEWDGCNVGIEMVYLSWHDPADQDQRVKDALWLNGLVGGQVISAEPLKAALRKETGSNRVAVAIGDQGEAIEVQWMALDGSQLAPASLFSRLIVYSYIGPEGL
ncbi:MAG: hypothetical protein II007_01965 [Gammaproteobacteria bacterium]|nr:hypothetical protein [Gammaproteobacteria bacterium]